MSKEVESKKIEAILQKHIYTTNMLINTLYMNLTTLKYRIEFKPHLHS